MLFVYDLIEELCMQKGINVTKLCKDCKIPRSTLSDYKKGRIKSLSADTVCKIADYFGVSVDYICRAEISEDEETKLKSIMFGDSEKVTDEMWQELKDYAKFLLQKYYK